jgi:hypothetical protein
MFATSADDSLGGTFHLAGGFNQRTHLMAVISDHFTLLQLWLWPKISDSRPGG